MNELSDDDIDALLRCLYHDAPCKNITTSKRIEDFSNEELLRIRSQNHPDKYPNGNQAVYQAAVEEINKRRQAQQQTNRIDNAIKRAPTPN